MDEETTGLVKRVKEDFEMAAHVLGRSTRTPERLTEKDITRKLGVLLGTLMRVHEHYNTGSEHPYLDFVKETVYDFCVNNFGGVIPNALLLYCPGVLNDAHIGKNEVAFKQLKEYASELQENSG